ncbi:hypothetical protein Angca_003782, partial [Angiostrongylus cantonensis]
GDPRLACSKQSLLFNFDASIPFQGRISIVEKIYNPSCVQDYSSNIQRNATFRINLRNCMNMAYLNNGSREFSAHLEIGFHPLVITSSDRVFSVKCIDNSYAVAHPTEKTSDDICSHSVRLTSRWESSTVFHVGDAVIHEWKCNFRSKEALKYQTFLTSCNAVSSSGQVLHLVDENGCIVDSELIGEIVYNSFIPKVFARARMFKLMNSEKYRIKCNIQMCSTDSVCKNRTFPPKCAFTKDEILKRYAPKTKTESIEGSIIAGTINNVYERQVKVASEWITVHSSEYTNIEQLNERFFLSTTMDENKEEDIQPSPKHFLMEISYSSPNDTNSRRTESEPHEIASSVGVVTNQSPTTQSTSSIFTVEAENDDGVVEGDHRQILWNNPKCLKLMRNLQRGGSNSFIILVHKPCFLRRNTLTSTASTVKYSATTDASRVTEGIVNTETGKEHSVTIIKSSLLGAQLTKVQLNQDQTLSSDISALENEASFFGLICKTIILESPSTMFLYKITPVDVHVEKSTEEPLETEPVVHKVINNDVNAIRNNKLPNFRDWRLDDRTINESDIHHERQLGCSNATIIASHRNCSWSGIEHLLVVWSFTSLLLWIAMIAVCFYRQANKPTWAKFREREQQRMTQARVIQHDHPWMHADAFEETQNRSKNDLTMLQNTY